MRVELKPTSTIITGLGLQKGGPAHKFLTNTCYKTMDKYVPRKEGYLRETVDITASTITYEMPYAHAQYVGYTKGPVSHYTTPGTGPYWDKRMWSAEKDRVVKQVQNYVNKYGG